MRCEYGVGTLGNIQMEETRIRAMTIESSLVATGTGACRPFRQDDLRPDLIGRRKKRAPGLEQFVKGVL